MTTAWLFVAATLPFVTQIEGRSGMLAGLPGVAVVIEDTAPEVRARGLSEERLRDRAVAALRQAEITVLEASDAMASARQPLLVVRLETIRLPSSQVFAWSLAVAVHQRTASSEHRRTRR